MAKRIKNKKTSKNKNTYGAKKRSGNMMYGFNPHYKTHKTDLVG